MRQACIDVKWNWKWNWGCTAGQQDAQCSQAQRDNALDAGADLLRAWICWASGGFYGDFSAVQEASDEVGTGPCRWLTLRQAGYWNTQERSHWLKTAVRGTESWCVCVQVCELLISVSKFNERSIYCVMNMYDQHSESRLPTQLTPALCSDWLVATQLSQQPFTTLESQACADRTPTKHDLHMSENISFLQRFGAGARHLLHSSDCQTHHRQRKTLVLIR